MKLENKEIEILVKDLRSRHQVKFDELLRQSKKLVAYVRGLNNFVCAEPDPILNVPHVGRVIVDAVLQVGHDYEKQVRKRVHKIISFPEASTISGFLKLLREQGIFKLLDWNSSALEKDLIAVANFFAERNVESYLDLKEWLRSEDNRDSLLSDSSGLGGNSTFKVADKTADYFRVLVGHADAVAVDSNIKAVITNAGIRARYSYKEMRTIIQMAAVEMNMRPIDLDASIYNDSVVHPERYKRSENRKQHYIDERSSKKRIKVGEDSVIERMPKKGDIFEGKINDLCQYDVEGWKRRDISFFKHELTRRDKFGYPTRNDQITLLDTEGNRYEMNFSKPDLDTKVCLGTPSRLKPWYRKKGFDDKVVNPNDKVYFEYTGHGVEFIIFTEHEYRSRHNG